MTRSTITTIALTTLLSLVLADTALAGPLDKARARRSQRQSSRTQPQQQYNHPNLNFVPQQNYATPRSSRRDAIQGGPFSRPGNTFIPQKATPSPIPRQQRRTITPNRRFNERLQDFNKRWYKQDFLGPSAPHRGNQSLPLVEDAILV